MSESMQASSWWRKASEPAKREIITLEHALDLPETPDFVSILPPVSPEVVFRWSEELLPQFNARPDAEERRLRDKCRVPFEL